MTATSFTTVVPGSTLSGYGRTDDSLVRNEREATHFDAGAEEGADDSSTTAPVSGSCIPTAGGEAPIEQYPSSKFCVESHVPLGDSLMWDMLKNYYKKMAIEAWSHNYVPSFVTSNSRLARSYGRVIFYFLKEWFNTKSVDSNRPVYILELGAGHGRFTFLVIKALLRYKEYFEVLGLPKKPFLYIYSDIAEANIDFCSKHPKLQSLADDGWLDFAFVDGNRQPLTINLRNAGSEVPVGSPLITIANYVLDSLITDAYQIKQGELYRGLVAMYSPQKEPDPTNPDIMTRMSVTWQWSKLSMPIKGWKEPAASNKTVAKDESHPHYPEYLKNGTTGDSNIWKVFEKYLSLEENMSFMLPVGSMMLLKGLRDFSNGNMLVLVGDKGYTSYEEFIGIKPPHIAVHGSVSFMVNLHSLRVFTEECLQGRSGCTPWRDTFQLMGLWGSGKLVSGANGKDSKKPPTAFTSSVFAFADDLEDMSPDSLVNWQRDWADRLNAQTSSIRASSGNLKTLLSLLRYSGHDPDLFWNFRSQFTKWCVPPFTSSRTDADICIDIEHVYNHWYKLRDGEDVPDLCGHICMKVGQCDKAIFYFQESIKYCPEALHAATYVNMAACYKVVGKLDEAAKCCEKALQMSPGYQPSLELQTQLKMCLKPVKIVALGCGTWIRNECLQLLLRDKRCQLVAAVAFSDSQADWFRKSLLPHLRARANPSDGIAPESSGTHSPKKATVVDDEAFEVYRENQLKDVLIREDIDACLLDVHPQAGLADAAIEAWKAGKHLLTRTPVSFTAMEVMDLINKYSQVSKSLAWHVIENNRTEDAFVQANKLLSQLGIPVSVTIQFVSDSALSTPSLNTSPYSEQEYLAVEVLHCLNAVQVILGLDVTALCIQCAEKVTTAQKLRCTHKRNEGYNDSGANEETDQMTCPKEEDQHVKTNQREIEARRLCGWAKFGDSVMASILVTRYGGDNVLKYWINATCGSLEIRKTGAAWQLTANPITGSQLETAVHCIGHQSSHDAWMHQIYNKQASYEEVSKHKDSGSISVDKKQDAGSCNAENQAGLVSDGKETTLVDISVSKALLDGALMQSILSSVAKNGVVISIGHRNAPVKGLDGKQ